MSAGHSPAVTVIMPAYNAAAYIENSVQSVLGQTMPDFELIIVNDGSTDDTAAVLAELAGKDGRIKPLNIANSGPALARNHALDSVDPGSRYIAFIDSDDELLPDALEYALSAADGGADIIISGFTIVNADGSTRDYSEPESRLELAAIGDAFGRLYRANLLNQVWGKLYKAELILSGRIRFQDYRWGEDRLFVFDCLERAERLAVLPECKYRYIMHKGESLISRFYDKKAEVCLKIDRQVQQLCLKFGIEDQSWFKYMFAKSIFSCFTNLFSPSCKLSRKEKLDYIDTILSDPYVPRRCEGAAGGFAVSFLCAVVRSGSAVLNLFVFRLVALAGQLAPKLFMAIKHKK